MFDIITTEPEDSAVKMAVNVITTNPKAMISVPHSGFRYIAINAQHTEGDGGSGKDVLVVVGHAGPDSISGASTWSAYVQEVTAKVDPDWRKNKKTVYLVACSTAGSGQKFLYQHIAQEVKNAFPGATVWASTTAVSARDLSGDWIQV